MTAPTVHIRETLEDDGRRFVEADIEETDDASGVTLRFGPLPDGTTVASMPDDIRAAMTAAATRMWHEANADDDGERLVALIERGKALGGRVEVQHMDGTTEKL